MACDPTPEVALDRSKIASVSFKINLSKPEFESF